MISFNNTPDHLISNYENDLYEKEHDFGYIKKKHENFFWFLHIIERLVSLCLKTKYTFSNRNV